MRKYRWTKDLSWDDGTIALRATYFASPRMWPLGYILGSEYSPLLLEQQMPNLNWRDSFEDLLALESGNKMISAVSRQNEAITAFRVRSESVHNHIQQVNQRLQDYQDYNGLLQELREVLVRQKDSELLERMDNVALPGQKESTAIVIASGKAQIDNLKDLENKPASKFKQRVHWITSLISSCSMLGWESAVYDSADGLLADVYKADGAGDGQMFSETDLATIFRDGHPLDFRTPSWSTYEGGYERFSYPDIEELSVRDGDPDAAQTYDAIEKVRPSILSQLTKVQQKMSWNGSIETRVVLKNRFSNGEEAEKTIVNDASKVFEETEKFHASIKERHHSVGLALWKLQYKKQQDVLTYMKELEDEGV